MYARVSVFDRRWYLADVRRLAEALNYKTRMERAGVPLKTQRKILARWKAWPFAMRREMAGLISDISRAA